MVASAHFWFLVSGFLGFWFFGFLHFCISAFVFGSLSTGIGGRYRTLNIMNSLSNEMYVLRIVMLLVGGSEDVECLECTVQYSASM